MVYRLSEQGASTSLTVLGLSFDARSAPPWFVFAAVLAAGLAALRIAARRVDERWGAIQLELQAKAP
jgi:branched-chain amino acid transport system permease protein